MFSSVGVPEILVIALIFVLLFGAKRLPEAARSIGRSMRIFKAEVKEMSNDDAPAAQPQQQLPPAQSAQPIQQMPQQPVQQPVEQPLQQPNQNPQQ